MQLGSEPDFKYEAYTAKDYRAWPYEGYFEIIKGKAFRLTPPGYTTMHQSTFGGLLFKLYDILKDSPYGFVQGPFEVYLTNYPNKFEETDTVVMPDFIVSAHKDELQNFGYVGVPDLIIEIISARTAKKDLNEKFKAYEAFGVKEYWVVWPGENCVLQFRNRKGSLNQEKIICKGSEIQSFCFPEIQFPIADIFSND